MPTKKAPKPNPDAIIQAYEQYGDFMLMDALDGMFDIEADLQAAAAFSIQDLDALTKLCEQRKREVNFIEANDVIEKAPKPKSKNKAGKKVERDFTTAERYQLLKRTKGTRAYARALLAAQDGGTPFG